MSRNPFGVLLGLGGAPQIPQHARVGAANSMGNFGGGGYGFPFWNHVPFGGSGGGSYPQLPPGMPGGGGACNPCTPAPYDANLYAAQQASWQMQCEARAAATARAANSVILANSPQISLPLNSVDHGAGTIIAAGTSRVLTTSPSVALCITQFRVTRTSAPFFLIDSIRTARQEYFADGGGAPADNYAADANRLPMELPSILPGTNISVTVRNIDVADHHFFSEFIGLTGPNSCGPCL